MEHNLWPKSQEKILISKDTQAFDNFKNKQKNMYGMFFDIWKYFFWKFIQYTKMKRKCNVKKNHSEKINGAKNVLFTLSRAPKHEFF